MTMAAFPADRAALQKLLIDVQARRIDVIVVYRVDRLTRSLADFAKLVETFANPSGGVMAKRRKANGAGGAPVRQRHRRQSAKCSTPRSRAFPASTWISFASSGETIWAGALPPSFRDGIVTALWACGVLGGRVAQRG